MIAFLFLEKLICIYVGGKIYANEGERTKGKLICIYLGGKIYANEGGGEHDLFLAFLKVF